MKREDLTLSEFLALERIKKTTERMEVNYMQEGDTYYRPLKKIVGFLESIDKRLEKIERRFGDESGEFSRLFQLTAGDYMTREDLEIKAKYCQEMADYYEEKQKES